LAKNFWPKKWRDGAPPGKTKKLNISRPLMLGEAANWGFLIETTYDEYPKYGPAQEKKKLPYPLILTP